MVILDDATEVEEDEEKQAFQNDVFLLLPTADCKVTKEPLQLSATAVTESFQHQSCIQKTQVRDMLSPKGQCIFNECCHFSHYKSYLSKFSDGNINASS